MRLAITVLVFSFSAVSMSVDPASVRDRVFSFLEKNVMGRTQKVATQGTIESDGVVYSVDFSADIKWDSLKKTEDGLTFQETRDIKQTSSKPGAGGKTEAFVTDRVVILSYALAERQTTKSLVGIVTETKNTLEDPTGRAFVAMVEPSVDNKELYIYQALAGFSEASLDGKTLVPFSTATQTTLFLNASNKLVSNETVKFYKVDINKDFAKTELNRFELTAVETK